MGYPTARRLDEYWMAMVGEGGVRSGCDMGILFFQHSTIVSDD